MQAVAPVVYSNKHLCSVLNLWLIPLQSSHRQGSNFHLYTFLQTKASSTAVSFQVCQTHLNCALRSFVTWRKKFMLAASRWLHCPRSFQYFSSSFNKPSPPCLGVTRRERRHNSPGAKLLRRTPKSPNNVTSTIFNAVRLLPNDQVRTWGRQTCLLPRAPCNLVTPLPPCTFFRQFDHVGQTASESQRNHFQTFLGEINFAGNQGRSQTFSVRGLLGGQFCSKGSSQ